MSASPAPVTLGTGDEAGSAATADPRPQRGSITSLLILSLFVLIMTNNGGSDDLAVRNQYLDSLSSLEWQLGNYSAWLNGSADANFTMVRIPFASLAPSMPNHLSGLAHSTTGRASYHILCTLPRRSRSAHSIILF